MSKNKFVLSLTEEQVNRLQKITGQQIESFGDIESAIDDLKDDKPQPKPPAPQPTLIATELEDGGMIIDVKFERNLLIRMKQRAGSQDIVPWLRKRVVQLCHAEVGC